jgi:hypothetical protein
LRSSCCRPGAARAHYRDYADRDTYAIVKERLFDWRWGVPTRPVEVDPRSRMAYFAHPNLESIPPDEPTTLDFQTTTPVTSRVCGPP